MDEAIKKQLREIGVTDEEIQGAEMAREVVFEICRQYDATASNAKTMIHNNNLKPLPFGIVCSIVLGDQVLFQQVQGRPSAVKVACKSIASVIAKHEEDA